MRIDVVDSENAVMEVQVIDYSRLEEEMDRCGTNKSEMGCVLGISSRTIAKISKGEKISDNVLKRIGEYLECDFSKLYREVSDNPLLQLLRDEKNAGIPGGLYHELQIRMTYNSNRIEGSRLTEEQTRMIFETSTVDGHDSISVDDVLETVHHFKAVDYCIDIAEEPLSEDIIKHLHYMLKTDTKDSAVPWFAVGEYKKRPNMVGGTETAPPGKVESEIRTLLNGYLAKDVIYIEDIIDFHAEFEKIHPFQDGNGRVGRLIAFKECLKNSIVPFIIEDAKKMYYYRGLANWNSERGYLVDTCLDGQDAVKRLISYYEDRI